MSLDELEQERLVLVADYDQLMAERQRLIDEGADPAKLVVPEFPSSVDDDPDPDLLTEEWARGEAANDWGGS